MVVVGAFGPEREVDEVRVDPGDGRKVALGSTLQEAAMPEEVLPVVVAGDRLAGEPVGRVDHPESGDVVVRVPAPTDTLACVEMADERRQVVRTRGLEVVAMTRPRFPRRRSSGSASSRRRRSRTSDCRRRTPSRGSRRPAAARPCGRPSRCGAYRPCRAASAASSSSSRRNRSSSRSRSARRRPCPSDPGPAPSRASSTWPPARDTTCRGPCSTLPAVAPRRRRAPRRG